MHSRGKRKKRPTELGKRIASARERAGLRPSALAKLCGVDNTQVWKWEKDGVTPKADSLRLIASACRCSIDDLLGSKLDFAERAAS